MLQLRSTASLVAAVPASPVNASLPAALRRRPALIQVVAQRAHHLRQLVPQLQSLLVGHLRLHRAQRDQLARIVRVSVVCHVVGDGDLSQGLSVVGVTRIWGVAVVVAVVLISGGGAELLE